MQAQQDNQPGTAVITGASAGLGAIFADRLAKRGYNLVLVARRKDKLEQLATQLENRYQVKVTNLVADLSNPADIEKVSGAVAANTDITFFINNAGSTTIGPFIDSSFTAHQQVIDLNLNAVVRLSAAVLPGFKARNKGTLINIGSAVGFHSLAFTSVYSGTKAFIDKFTQGLQEELKDTAVKVRLVTPAGVATEIYDKAGVSLSAFDPALIMSADHCVDAVLNGDALDELTILPSVEDEQLYKAYEAARLQLFAATQTGKPASRYQLS